MGHVVLVRHGKAAAGWSDDLDPGLDDLGRRQAEAMADALHLFGPLPLYSSPLLRCWETATALGDRWGVEPVVCPDVGEVESPTADLAERGPWLRDVMAGRWSGQAPALQAWRQRVVDFLLSIEDQDAVVVSHFVAINAAVSFATGDDRVIVFAPDNCSRTELLVVGGRLEVVELGETASTHVN
ncbi:MAG TPA: histidine phosphatase family protein [Acidimicrobiales bacterium]|nr:histidine phosphatase family protein [Acidimicrobiales bacterium]